MVRGLARPTCIVRTFCSGLEKQEPLGPSGPGATAGVHRKQRRLSTSWAAEPTSRFVTAALPAVFLLGYAGCMRSLACTCQLAASSYSM